MSLDHARRCLVRVGGKGGKRDAASGTDEGDDSWEATQQRVSRQTVDTIREKYL